jgi:hypothetical protein
VPDFSKLWLTLSGIALATAVFFVLAFREETIEHAEATA